MLLCSASFCFTRWTGKGCAVEELLGPYGVQRKKIWLSFWFMVLAYISWYKAELLLGFFSMKSRLFTVCRGRLRSGNEQVVNVVLEINK